MYLLRRFLPLITSAIFFFVFLFLHLQPHWFLTSFELEQFSMPWVVGAGSVLLILLVLAILTIGRGAPYTTRLRFTTFPLVAFLSSFTIFLFSDYAPLLYLIIILLPLMLWIWLESLYLLWQQPKSYQAYTLERLSNYLYIVNIFLFVIALTGLQILFQIPIWQISIMAVAIFWVIQFDQLQLYKLHPKESALFAILGTFLALQLFFVLNLLPTHFFMYGLFMSLFFYCWLGIGRQILQRNQSLASSLPYVIVSTSGFVLTFVTSLWIT